MPFVDNRTLQEALLASHMAGHVTNECYAMFEDISKQRIRRMLKHNVEEHFDQMLTWCVDKCLRIWQNYSFKRDNAFAYFVTVIDNTCKLYFKCNDVYFVSIDEQDARLSEKS